MLSWTNIARETGISAKAVRGYFETLDDTFLGCRLKPWRASKKRRMTLTDKFYFFDVGAANYLAGRHPVPGSSVFGKSFEHFIFMELMSYKKYRDPELELHYWRTSSGREVDFICGDRLAAIEVKASARIHAGHLKGLKALKENGGARHLIIVCLESEPRELPGGISVLPWRVFLKKLWKEGLLR